MPPKKRRKRSASKPRAPKPFVWDRVLSAYTALSCCCLTGLTSMMSAAGFGVAFTKPFRDGLKDYSSEASKFIRPEYGLALGILALCLTVFSFALVLGLWNSRKWSLWVVLALHLPGAVLAASTSDIRSAVPAVAVVIYCLLRVTNTLGPK